MRIECLDVLNRARLPVVRLLTRFLHHQEIVLQDDFFSIIVEGKVIRIRKARINDKSGGYSRSDEEATSEAASRIGKSYHPGYSGGNTRRHELQRAGYTGRNNVELHALNCSLTNALSNSELVSRYRERHEQRLPTGQLEAALRDRGIKFYNE